MTKPCMAKSCSSSTSPKPSSAACSPIIIGEQAALDGFGEVDDEQLFAIQGFVIHGTQGHFAGLGLDLGAVSINARRGSHVQAFGSTDVIRIVNANEGTFVIVPKGGARGAVCFVADHQIEGWQAMLALGATDHVD